MVTHCGKDSYHLTHTNLNLDIMNITEKLPFNRKKFFWAFCKVTRYISEPDTSVAGDRFVTVHTYDKEMAETLKTMLTLAFDVKGILTNHVDGTKFVIQY